MQGPTGGKDWGACMMVAPSPAREPCGSKGGAGGCVASNHVEQLGGVFGTGCAGLCVRTKK